MTDDVKALVERLSRLLPVVVNNTPDYAELSFGDAHPTQAMTMAPDDWMALNDIAAALTAQADEIERLRKLTRPQWFYYGDDCSSDQCRGSVHECIDEDFLWGNKAEGSHVLEISTATNLPTIWALVHFFTDEEKDARNSDDDYEVTEFASEDEARAALKAAQEVKAIESGEHMKEGQ